MSVPVTVWKSGNYPGGRVYRYFNGRPHGYSLPRRNSLKRPFTMDEKKAYGPGVDDMKSGLLNMYYVVKELSKREHKASSLPGFKL